MRSSTDLKPGFRYYPRILDIFQKDGIDFFLGNEIMSGLTVGLIALPLALALGISSNPNGVETPLPVPTLGLVTAIIAGFLMSMLGGSRVQIGGPTAAFVPLILLISAEHGYEGLIISTMMAGCILLLMGFTGFGALVKYIPWPVTSGFTTGIAVALILSQLPDIGGLAQVDPYPREFIHKLLWLARHAGSVNLYNLGVAGLSIAIILTWPKFKLNRLPGSIVALVVSSLLVHLSGLSEWAGVETIATKFGPDALSTGIPKPSLPVVRVEVLRDLIGPATAIAILGAIESLLSAVVADGLSGGRHDSKSELIGQGIANIVCPLFGGLPATGAIARTSANVSYGAKTPLSGMTHSVALLMIVLVGSGLAGYIPMPAIGAVLVAVALRMGEWHELRRIPQLPLSDALVLLTTFSLTVVFDLVVAIEVGMVLAAMLFIKRVSATTEVSRVTPDDLLERPEHLAQGKNIPEGVLVYRIFGPFMFGAAEKMEDALSRIEHWPKILVLRLHLVPAMDATGMPALKSVVERMHKRGSSVIISGIHQQPLQLMRKAGVVELIGMENVCATFDEALGRANRIVEIASHASK